MPEKAAKIHHPLKYPENIELVIIASERDRDRQDGGNYSQRSGTQQPAVTCPAQNQLETLPKHPEAGKNQNKPQDDFRPSRLLVWQWQLL